MDKTSEQRQEERVAEIEAWPYWKRAQEATLKPSATQLIAFNSIERDRMAPMVEAAKESAEAAKWSAAATLLAAIAAIAAAVAAFSK